MVLLPACGRVVRCLLPALVSSCPRCRGRREGFVGAAICTGVVGWLLGRWLGRIDWLTSPRNVFLLGHGSGLNVVSPAYGVCGGLYTRVTRPACEVHNPAHNLGRRRSLAWFGRLQTTHSPRVNRLKSLSEQRGPVSGGRPPSWIESCVACWFGKLREGLVQVAQGLSQADKEKSVAEAQEHVDCFHFFVSPGSRDDC